MESASRTWHCSQLWSLATGTAVAHVDYSPEAGFGWGWSGPGINARAPGAIHGIEGLLAACRSLRGKAWFLGVVSSSPLDVAPDLARHQVEHEITLYREGRSGSSLLKMAFGGMVGPQLFVDGRAVYAGGTLDPLAELLRVGARITALLDAGSGVLGGAETMRPVDEQIVFHAACSSEVASDGTSPWVEERWSEPGGRSVSVRLHRPFGRPHPERSVEWLCGLRLTGVRVPLTPGDESAVGALYSSIRRCQHVRDRLAASTEFQVVSVSAEIADLGLRDEFEPRRGRPAIVELGPIRLLGQGLWQCELWADGYLCRVSERTPILCLIEARRMFLRDLILGER